MDRPTETEYIESVRADLSRSAVLSREFIGQILTSIRTAVFFATERTRAEHTTRITELKRQLNDAALANAALQRRVEAADRASLR